MSKFKTLIKHIARDNKINCNSKVYSPNQQAIAIIQPGCWGDNINSTLMLKPLRAKYPTANIDVYTSTRYASAYYNNPYINNILEADAHTKNEALHLVHTIPKIISTSNYYKIFNPHPMINPGNWNSIKHPHFGDNLIYAWVRALEHENIEYEMPLETILQLTSEEVTKINQYFEHVKPLARNILIEAGHESGQSHFTYEWLSKIVKYLANGETNIFISIASDGGLNELLAIPNVHFVGRLSIRECAEIFNRCDAFFSVSSGLSNACNTNWCKKDIKWFEAVNSPAVTSAPIRSEGKHFWYKNDIDGYMRLIMNNGL